MDNPSSTDLMLIAMREARQCRQRRKRRLQLYLALFALLTVLALVGLYFYDSHQAAQSLRDAIAETDRLDPHWRWDDIVKIGADLPDDQNAAIPIKAAALMIKGKGKWNDGKLIEHIGKKTPRYRAAPDVVEKLRQAVLPHLAVVSTARHAIPLQTGYYALPESPLGRFGTYAVDVLNLGRFLQHASELDIQNGNYEDAWTTALAILAADRSFGEEPTLFGHMARVDLRLRGVTALERILVNGGVADALLLQPQQQLIAAANIPILCFQRRGERAGWHEMLTGYETGKYGAYDLTHGQEVWQLRGYYLWGGSLEKNHAWILRQCNDMVDACKQPAPDRARVRELDKKSKDEATGLATKSLFLDLSLAADSTTQALTRLRCAATALAVERFRLNNNRWPNSLAEVVDAKLLDKIPDDPLWDEKLRAQGIDGT